MHDNGDEVDDVDDDDNDDDDVNDNDAAPTANVLYANVEAARKTDLLYTMLADEPIPAYLS